MPRYKRTAAEAELDVSTLEDPAPSDPTLVDMLNKLRNMWEFASLMQYIYLFGSVVKIDENLDIEDLEHECLQPHSSQVLADIGLALLKYVSSHRGLTHDIFAEYTRRQYLAKLPAENPFGDDEEPLPFNDLDIYTRVRVLQQLSTWTFNNADRIRNLMPEEDDHLTWRMEPLGWDADDHAYFVLDDNRLYRRADEPLHLPSPPKAKAKAKPAPRKKKKAAPPPPRGTRQSKRLKVEEEESEEEEEEAEESEEDVTVVDATMNGDNEVSGYGFTSKTWKCIAITLAEYQDFLSSIQRSRDANEKTLRKRIEEDVLPIIERRADAIKQKQLRKLRELENLQKMATAKRSSRLADKADRQAKEDEERAIEAKKIADLRMAREEVNRQRRIEEGHESRRLTREQRLKEREVKRILHEEELARLDREASAVSQGDGLEADADRKRLSSRNLQNQQEAHRKELERLHQDQEEDKWYFDCVVCGKHGENMDDGSHSVACERCNVWQHSGCHGLTPEQCENEDFHFVCQSCNKKEKAAREREKAEKSGIVLKLGKQSPQAAKSDMGDTINVSRVKKEAPLPDYVQQQLDGLANARAPQPHFTQWHAYQPPMQQMPPYPAQPGAMPQYQPHMAPQYHNGYGGQPQRAQYSPPTQGAASFGLAQHNWMHQSAVNGAPPPSSYANQSPPRPVMTTQSPVLPRPDQAHRPLAPSSTQPQVLASAARPQAEISQTAEQRAILPPHTPATSQARRSSTEGKANNFNHVMQQSPLLATPNLQPSPQRTPQAQHSVGATPGPLPSSPHTSFPPPMTDYNRQAAMSPLKSSPPRPVQQSPKPAHMTNGHGPQHLGSFNASVASASPGASFEHAPKLATPSKTVDVAVSPANNATAVATNGMKGPWPDGSLSVPHKNDVPPTQ